MEITDELTQKIYVELEAHAQGDIETLRTILITMLAATLIGLTEEQVEEQIMRVVNLADKNREIKTNETRK